MQNEPTTVCEYLVYAFCDLGIVSSLYVGRPGVIQTSVGPPLIHLNGLLPMVYVYRTTTAPIASVYSNPLLTARSQGEEHEDPSPLVAP